MRRTASSVLRDLEIRVARQLEKSAGRMNEREIVQAINHNKEAQIGPSLSGQGIEQISSLGDIDYIASSGNGQSLYEVGYNRTFVIIDRGEFFGFYTDEDEAHDDLTKQFKVARLEKKIFWDKIQCDESY